MLIIKIINLCQQNNIALRVYQSPIYKGKYKSLPVGLSIINHIDILKDEKYFYDRIHVSQKGREIATKELIDQLILTY